MKKVIYGILILIGVAAITSNFMVDSSKLDHKKVSASGTACRWISNTGYGVGPIYYDETKANSLTAGRDYYTALEKFERSISLVDCDDSVQGVKLSGGIVYDSNNTPLAKTISVTLKNKTTSMEFSTGKVSYLKEYRYYTLDENLNLTEYLTGSYYILKDVDFYLEPSYRLNYQYDKLVQGIAEESRVLYDLEERRDEPNYTLEQLTKSPTEYICVCAEY